MNADLTGSIVRILRSDGRTTAGTGFVVAEGLAVTCAHVIHEKSRPKEGRAGEDVQIIFRADGTTAKAEVVVEWWRPVEAGDVAFLRLKEKLPPGVRPLPLGSSQGTEDHSFRTFGFPPASPEEGIWGDGHILAETLMQGMRVLQLSSPQITPGFSGAPVYDTISRRAVGMVTATASQDEHGRLAETAFITPVETLRMICPALASSDIQPYLGLAAFTESDAEFFFGRRREVDRLLSSLAKEPRFLAVLGPSGSGKSSVIGAGLIPALRRCALPGSDRWGIITGRPGDRPFENIASSGLEGAGLGLAGAAKEWLSKNPDRTRMVLVLDQFEELFATASPEKRRDFLEQLRELLEADLPLTLLLVMRDDFFSRLAQEAPPSLFEWVRGFVHISSGLEEAELEEIVRGPAGKVGLQFEEGLSEVVIKDVLESSAGGERAGRSTILPLLEFTLTELWMRRRDGYLTHDAYAAIGGVTGSLTQWADKAYQGLVGEGLGDAARRVLTGLVNPGDQRHSIPDSRRRRPIQDICVDDRQKESINIAVKFLADARLIATSFDQQSRVETVEIIHDSLIREWGKLRQWLNEDRNFLAWQKEMDKRVEAWEETSTDKEKRESGRLLRGLDLSEAENWMKERGRDLSAGKREFIQTSIELREKEIKRIRKEKNRRNIIIFFALFSLMALFLASITFNEKIRADEKTQDATALYLASQSEIGRASSGDSLLKSILLAVESLRHRNTSAGMIALQKGLDLLAKPIPQLSSSNYSYAVAFSPDNTKFATAERDGFAKIWDINNARLVHILNHHGEVTAIAFSHDGDKIATGSGDNTAVVWSAETGEMLHQLNHVSADQFLTPRADPILTPWITDLSHRL